MASPKGLTRTSEPPDTSTSSTFQQQFRISINHPYFGSNSIVLHYPFTIRGASAASTQVPSGHDTVEIHGRSMERSPS